MTKTTIFRWLTVPFVVLALIGALGGYKFFEISNAIAFAESMPEHSETVEALSPRQTYWSPVVKTVGEIKATRQVELKNEIGGAITKVNFVAGEKVKKGQVLLQLDISEELAQHQSAKVSADLARRVLKRTEQLKEQGALSEDAYDQAKADLGVNLAQMARMKAIIAKKTLKAPFDAIAGLHTLEAGQYLPANTDITTLVGHSNERWVDFTLAQQQLGLGDDSALKVTLQSDPTVAVEAKVIATESTVSSNTRNLAYRATFDDDHNRFKPGMLVTVSLTSNQAYPALQVPNTAVLRDSFQAYVYLLKKDDKGNYRAEKTPVKVLAEEDAMAIFQGNLDASSLIAANGSFKLFPGVLVNVVDKSEQLSGQPLAGDFEVSL